VSGRSFEGLLVVRRHPAQRPSRLDPLGSKGQTIDLRRIGLIKNFAACSAQATRRSPHFFALRLRKALTIGPIAAADPVEAAAGDTWDIFRSKTRELPY
jgi:hypothetical protein